MLEERNVEKSELLKQLRIDRSDTGAPRSRARWFVLVGCALLVLAGGLLWFSLTRPEPPTVRTAVARAASQASSTGSVLDASGYVTARRQATVSAKITGKVAEVLIEEGMRVKEGAVLARLDDTEAKAQLALAKAQLTAARSQLAEIRAQLIQVERDYTRQRGLANRQLISAQALDAALAQRDMLRARLASTEEQIRVAQESVAVAQVQLDNTVVRAPFSGVVVAKAAQPGEMISPISAGGGFTRTGIGTIVDMDSLEIQVDVNEAFINRVKPDQPVEAMLNAYPDWKIPGEVIAIIPTADRSKATVKVRIAIKLRDPRIVPDMGVRVAFLDPQPAQPAPLTSGVLVPAEAVRADGAMGVVFVYADGKVERRSVTLGQTVGGQRQVQSGLRDGERVVLSPPESLQDGHAVKLAEQRCTMSHLVEIRGLTKTYVRGREKIEVLHGINLDIPRGDFVALMGPSGSGKTTLLNLIGGLDTPTAGSIMVDGQRIDQLSSGELSRWRAAHVGFVFQFYNLLPVLSAQRNVELPLLLTNLSAAQRRQHAEIALTLVGLQDRARHKPKELSGGQEQRVAIARAIVSDPTLLVCDEPTGDLDRATADEILTLLQMLNREHEKTVVMVTHDPKAAEYARRQLHLDKGTLANGQDEL